MFRSMGELVRGLRLDSIANLYTGLGDALYDRNKHNRFEADRRLDDDELAALYNDEHIGRLICELPYFDALRQGFTVTVKDDERGAEKGADALRYTERLDVHGAFQFAGELDRAFGGAAIWVGLDDGTSEDAAPVREDALRTVLFLRVLDRRRVTPWTYDIDTRSPTYNQATLWAVLPQEVVTSRTATERKAAKSRPPVAFVHASRLIVFPGRNVTDDRRVQNSGWGDSIFQACLNPLERDALTWATLAQLISKSAQGVLKVQDLATLATSGDKDAVKARFELIRMGRSVVKDLVIDATEDYQQTKPDFGNLPEVLYVLMHHLSSAVQIPVTRLFGMSPGGLNSTGENDERNWQDVVQALRTHRLAPRLRRFYDLVFLAKDGPTGGRKPESYDIAFPPLRQMTMRELAEVRKLVADTDHLYMQNQVYSATECALNRFRADGWSMETVIDLDLRKEIQEVEAERAVEEAKNPPEPVAVEPDEKDEDEQNANADEPDQEEEP